MLEKETTAINPKTGLIWEQAASPIHYIAPSHLPQNLPFPMGRYGPPFNITSFLGPLGPTTPNGISIKAAVFSKNPRSLLVTNGQTNGQTE